MSSEPREAAAELLDEPREDRGAEEDVRLVAPRTDRICEAGAANPVEVTPDSPPPLDPPELDPEALDAEDEEEDDDDDERDAEDEEDPEEDDPLPPEEPPEDPRDPPPIPRIPSPVKPPKLRLPLIGGAIIETYLSATVDPVSRITRLTWPRETVRVRKTGPAVPPPSPVVSV